MGWLADRIVEWQQVHGRNDLPWQNTRDPYRIWVSEIMLQQTQVSAVMRYYQDFLARFPDVATLASAPDGDVMAAWSGLGYYSRARNLHACARCVMDQHGGKFPTSAEQLQALPGIGRSTAAAIAAFAFGERAAILDGNVKRVFCRVFGIDGVPDSSQTLRQLWVIAQQELPDRALERYTQGLMDLGATLCTRSRPRCVDCPVSERCVAYKHERTTELPARKRRREPQRRSTTMFLLRRGEEVLLERRPVTGIWGGLWSLPQADVPDGLDIAALGLQVRRQTELPGFEHAFTHFRLWIQPVLCEVGALSGNRVAEPAGSLWLNLAEVDTAALPAPVKVLLRQVRDGAGSSATARGAVAGIDERSPGEPRDQAVPSAFALPSRGSAGTRKDGSRPSSRTRSGKARRSSG